PLGWNAAVSAAGSAASSPPSSAPARQSKISVRDFDFYYGAAKVLHGINLDIPDRKVTALIGPSGCGKSTFISSINRMNDIIPEARASGTILIDGRDVDRGDADVGELRRRVGVGLQKLYP